MRAMMNAGWRALRRFPRAALVLASVLALSGARHTLSARVRSGAFVMDRRAAVGAASSCSSGSSSWGSSSGGGGGGGWSSSSSSWIYMMNKHPTSGGGTLNRSGR